MSATSDKVGHKHPPSSKQWKKGQSGNPGGRPKSRPEGLLETIDGLLMKQVEVTENGRKRLVPTIEAIVLQLFGREIAGDPKALRLLLKYEDLAQRDRPSGVKITFADSDAGTPAEPGRDAGESHEEK